MTQDDEPSKPLNNEQLENLGAHLLVAVLRSASTDDISKKDWWRRAQAALHVGAARSEAIGQMVSKMADKLEIKAPNTQTSREIISSICSALNEHDQFQQFRAICERDAFMVTARAQMLREQERQEAGYSDGEDLSEVDFSDPFGEQFDDAMDLPKE